MVGAKLWASHLLLLRLTTLPTSPGYDKILSTKEETMVKRVNQPLEVIVTAWSAGASLLVVSGEW